MTKAQLGRVRWLAQLELDIYGREAVIGTSMAHVMSAGCENKGLKGQQFVSPWEKGALLVVP